VNNAPDNHAIDLFTWNLPSNGRADFGFSIFEEFHKCGDEIAGYGFFVYSFRNLRLSQRLFLS